MKSSDLQENKSSELLSGMIAGLPETSHLVVVKRNGMMVPFRRERIARAIEAAFRDTKKTPFGTDLASGIQIAVDHVTDMVVAELIEWSTKKISLTVEGIQDLVEITLMKHGYHDVARDYIIYRDQHKTQRGSSLPSIRVLRSDTGYSARFNPIKLAHRIEMLFSKSSVHFSVSNESERNLVNQVIEKMIARIHETAAKEGEISSDQIEVLLEEELMRCGAFDAARTMIYEKAEQKIKHDASIDLTPQAQKVDHRVVHVIGEDGKSYTLSAHTLRRRIEHACRGYETLFSLEDFIDHVFAHFYEGIRESEISTAMIMAARTRIEIEPAFNYITARLLLDVVYRETIECSALDPDLKTHHATHFANYIRKGISYERLTPDLLDFDLEQLGAALDMERDLQFQYLGLQTLYDRYFIHHQQRRLETPQYFWMRVAMGLSLREEDKTAKAIEFYNLLSSFDYTSATPTLFNSGTCHCQLSSCYLSTVKDDLGHIFKLISDDAQLSKWAGGIGNDWTPVRATGAHIKGTNGQSQGVIPFLKVANDTAVAVNQGGKRKGAMCAYLETWHLDIEDFLELRKNTGDERRRTHDMNTANWIPDLFMKRVLENGKWTLFSPNDVPDLHDLYGKAFEERYHTYEAMAEEGRIKLFKKVEAVALWRKMLSMLFETGHPWITFKDPSNIRSPQDHVGVVHSSNLCTEILLNTSEHETAVCNLGSVNLAQHVTKEGIDHAKLAKTVSTAIRMLDNVIDINFYPTPEAEHANKQHRPIGLGVMGFQDALYTLGYSFASFEAVEFADAVSEAIAYYAILASSQLAAERGSYLSYPGSKWDRGLLPQDTIELLEQERGMPIDLDRSCRLDWTPVRESIKKHGIRNSNTMAIAPTATIANIIGVMPCIEPPYKNLYVKSNLSGEFTVVCEELVRQLKERGLWDKQMLEDLKYYDGSILQIDRIPDDLKPLFLSAFEVDPEWLIECAARRQKWIDMGQSLNLYLAEPSGKRLHDMYFLAWNKGVKTTYYLRSLGATQIEKSTVDINKRGIQPRWMKNASASSRITIDRGEKPKSCQLGESCESCQ